MIPKQLRWCSRCGTRKGTKDYFGPCPNPECIESPFNLETMRRDAAERFALTNPPPKPAKWQGEPAEKCRQKKLLTGMSCLSGQENLFDT